ncbi:PEBP-like protein, partial [Sistotremastrum suecicum HHB10207 ss-3]
SLLTAIPFVSSQASNNTVLELEVVEANFQNAGIVPALLASFNPGALLTVSFAGVGDITPGQNLTIDQVKPTPQIVVTPANGSVSLGSVFTLAMVDAGPVGFDESQGQTRHWLANNVTLDSSLSFTSAVNITDYASPFPAAGSGSHRYVILLYSQPASFTPPANLSTPGVPVSAYDFNSYVQTTGLGPLVAGNYIQVEQGVSTISVSATSAVETSTLPAAKSLTSSKSSSTSGTSS